MKAIKVSNSNILWGFFVWTLPLVQLNNLKGNHNFQPSSFLRVVVEYLNDGTNIAISYTNLIVFKSTFIHSTYKNFSQYSSSCSTQLSDFLLLSPFSLTTAQLLQLLFRWRDSSVGGAHALTVLILSKQICGIRTKTDHPDFYHSTWFNLFDLINSENLPRTSWPLETI